MNNKVIYLNAGVSRGDDADRVVSRTVTNLAPSDEEVSSNAVVDHKADPIKDIATIHRISNYLIDSCRYRDNMLFILGINFGLRVSDLIQIRFSDLIDENMHFKKTFPILEKKTSKTRKTPQNRYITINEAVMDAVELYLLNTDNCKLSDYVFRGESSKSNPNKPMHRNTVDIILKGIAKDLDLDIHMSTHTLRKTFGYHQMMMGGNSQRKLLLLQKMFGHSSPAITMSYIGITDDEIVDAYKNFNLGGEDYAIVNAEISDGSVAI